LKNARARARAPSRVEGRPLFAGGAGGGTGEISGCCNNLDPRTPGRVALSHAIECGEYNATELPQAVSKTFPSTPPIHTTEAQMTKRFLAFEARHKGSSRFSGLPGVPPKVAGPGGGGGVGRGRDATLARRSHVPEGAILLMRARARARASGCQMAYIFSDSGEGARKKERGERPNRSDCLIMRIDYGRKSATTLPLDSRRRSTAVQRLLRASVVLRRCQAGLKLREELFGKARRNSEHRTAALSGCDWAMRARWSTPGCGIPHASAHRNGPLFLPASVLSAVSPCRASGRKL
jgi:hypothetical protein